MGLLVFFVLVSWRASRDGASGRTDGRRRFACAVFAGLVGSAGCEVNPFSASAAVGLALLGTSAATAFAAGCAKMITDTSGIFGDGCIASHAFCRAVLAECEDTAALGICTAVHRAVSLADTVS